MISYVFLEVKEEEKEELVPLVVGPGDAGVYPEGKRKTCKI